MDGSGIRRRIEGGAAAGALIAAAVAVAFGTGFTAGRTLLADAGAWLSNGTTVSHVNAGTGRHDATIDADLVGEVGAQDVVTSTSGTAVVDTAGGTVTSLDTTTMSPGATAQLPEGGGRRQPWERFLVAGRFGYLIGERVVQPVDPVTLRHAARRIEVGQVGGAVVTAERTLAVLDAEHGTVVEVVDGVTEMPVEVARRPGPERLQLTAVGGRPVVVDTGAGSVRRLRPDGSPEDPVRVPALAGLRTGDVAVAAPGAGGSTAWLVRRADGELLGVDLDTRRVRSAHLDRRGAGVQAPVVLEGIVYVPSGTTHDVTVVDGTSPQLHQIARHEPEGSSDRLEVFAHGGRVWINDPAAQRALVVEADGRTRRVVDKGTGRGLGAPDDRDDGDGAPPASRPAGAGAPAPRPAPGAGPPSGAPPAGPPPVSPGLPGLPGLPESPGTPVPAPPPQADVPRVVGLGVGEACRRIEAARLVCDDRPVPEAPRGTDHDEVVRQDPPGGRLPVGGAVVVEHYAPDPIPVPDLAGQRVTLGGEPQGGPACRQVVQAGFTCSPRTVPAASGQPADEVLPGSQAPGPGSDELPGEAVTFEYAATTVVPDLAGMTPEAACDAVTELNLYCAVAYDPIGATPGRVAGQDPAAGHEVAADSPAARSQVTIRVPERTSVVPDVRNQDQATACTMLQAEQLVCSWQANPTNSIRNPHVADAQSIAPGTAVAPGTPVAVYHPSGPDVTLHRFRAYTADGQALERWAMAPDGGPGRHVYDMFHAPDRATLWRPDGTVGRCYSTQVEGSSPLNAFMRGSNDDPDHEFHFYADAGPGDEQYERGVGYYGPPTGVLCYVIPWEAAPATPVIEWWREQDHYYTAAGDRPGGDYTQVYGHWLTW